MCDVKTERKTIGEDVRIGALDKRLAAARQREEERNRPRVTGADAGRELGKPGAGGVLGAGLTRKGTSSTAAAEDVARVWTSC